MIEFRCSIAPLQSAIKIGADTMRLTLEIPLSEIENAIGMAALQGVALKASLEVDDNSLINSGETANERKTVPQRGVRKSQWQASEAARVDGDSGNGP